LLGVKSLSIIIAIVTWWSNLISKHIRLFNSCYCCLILDLLLLEQLLLQLLIPEPIHSPPSLDQEAKQSSCKTTQRNENWCENPSEYVISRVLAITVCSTVSVVCTVSALPRVSTLWCVICAITLWRRREKSWREQMK